MELPCAAIPGYIKEAKSLTQGYTERPITAAPQRAAVKIGKLGEGTVTTKAMGAVSRRDAG